jgi:hypothetical protein
MTMANIIIVGGKGRRETVLQVTEAAKGYNQLAMKGLRTLSALACCRNDLHRPSHLGPEALCTPELHGFQTVRGTRLSKHAPEMVLDGLLGERKSTSDLLVSEARANQLH